MVRSGAKGPRCRGRTSTGDAVGGAGSTAFDRTYSEAYRALAVAKFLQISDLHLGAPFGWLPADCREERRREQRRALVEGIAQAIERGVDAILIPGDLFDKDGVDAETLAWAVHAFDVAGCPPVFIAPGNHDPWSETSRTWSPRLLRVRGWAWPSHVHVFTSSGWSMKRLPRQPIEVWGRCFTANVPSAERPLDARSLEGVSPTRPGVVSLGLFHGSREGFCPPGQTTIAPFSDAEARFTPFTYMAVGHYHEASSAELPASDGGGRGARLAYSGSPVALNARELGRHGALEVTVEHGSGPSTVTLEPVPLDSRCVHDLTVDVSGAAGVEQIDDRIRTALDQAGAAADDLATVRLKGRPIRGVRYVTPGAELKARLFYLRVDPHQLRPDYDLQAYRNDLGLTTEHRFVRALLDRLDREQDPEQREIIEGALYYGLDAFRLGEVVPAYGESTE